MILKTFSHCANGVMPEKVLKLLDMFVVTTATRKVAAMSKRIRCCPGGTSASKTISILLLLIHKAQTDKKPTLTSIVSESHPHLKRGVIRDFKNIMVAHNYWNDKLWNATDSLYRFETGSQIEFFSADSPDKLRGARRDRLFVNEANNIHFEAFEQLEVRTKEFVFLDWNPSTEFWYYTDVKTKRNDVEECTLTYLDNEALDQQIVDSIEQRKNRKGWWQVYGLGQLGEVEGKIYKGWEIIDEIPKEARLVRRGLDFGYSNDPTAIVEVYKWNGAYILDEVMYRKGLSNKEIADILLLDETDTLVIADSAEPKSIDEIRMHGVSIVGAKKGKDSVAYGIQLVQDEKILMTKRSAALIKEYRNYLWMSDKNGKILNKPEGGLDHALDAIRYAIMSMGRKDSTTEEAYDTGVTAMLDKLSDGPKYVRGLGMKASEFEDYNQAVMDEFLSSARR